jgi:gliding motility-associated-like protein
MIKKVIWLFFIVISGQLKAQENLVPNGNFEDTVACSSGINAFGAVKDWFVPQSQFVDVNQPCLFADWWRFIRDRKVGINGSRSGFIETYYRGFADDFIYSGRRYLAVKLKEKLKAGQQYYFEMMVRSVDTFPNDKLVNTVFTDGQDVAFTRDFPYFEEDKYRNYLQLKPIIRSKFYKNYEWYKVNNCFIADGTETYLVIGNFRNDDNTEFSTTGKTNINFPSGKNADYIIDNVVLVPMFLHLRDTAVCQGETATFNILKTAPESVKYYWQDGSTAPQYTASQTEYINAQVAYSEQCTVSKTISFKVLTPDYKPIVRDTTVCSGQEVMFKAGVGLKGETVKWRHSGAPEREFMAQTEGVYTAEVKSYCVSWIDSFRLNTRDCGYGLFMPNIFSPNGDGLNDEFRPNLKADFLQIESYDLKIYNRWGNLIFKTKDIDQGWNGTLNGTKLPPDVYIWTLTIHHTFFNKKEVLNLSGDIMLSN